MYEDFDDFNSKLIESFSITISVLAFSTILFFMLYSHLRLKITLERSATFISSLMLLSFLISVIN